jgi:phosphoenolpyruvate---glycerone phosphotransferase subunit DhaK
MKKLINDLAVVVAEALRGMAVAHPELRVDHANRIVYPGDAPVAEGRTDLGRGSGHEPLHSGFVGPGMLDAACPGEIFTSPVASMSSATKTAVGVPGTGNCIAPGS